MQNFSNDPVFHKDAAAKILRNLANVMVTMVTGLLMISAHSVSVSSCDGELETENSLNV